MRVRVRVRVTVRVRVRVRVRVEVRPLSAPLASIAMPELAASDAGERGCETARENDLRLARRSWRALPISEASASSTSATFRMDEG